RVVSGRGGALKSAGLEAPFVGRERELKLIKQLFHASAQDRRGGLVLGPGEAAASWAPADMVRMRCLISEDESPGPAREKLRSTLLEHLLDPEERAFVEPCLADRVCLGERSSG